MEKSPIKSNEIKSNDAFKITGNWDAHSKNLKGKFSQLTDADLKFETGKENELIGRLETRLNKKHDEVVNIIKKVQTETV